MDCYWQAIDPMEMGSYKIKQEFFIAVAVSVRLYGCTTWRKSLIGTAQTCCVPFGTNLGSSTLQNGRYTTTHLPSQKTSKTNKTYWILLKKQGQTHKRHSPVDSNTWTHQCWQTNKKLYFQLCADTRCRAEDLPIMMADKERW